MPYSSPNQKMVTIHRADLGKSFLGINNDSWKTAARILTPPAFLLYIYFASNRDNFTLSLSPKAIQQEIGMARSTFYDQMNVLESLGYLVKDEEKKNGWNFYERPLGVPNAVFKSRETELISMNEPPRGFDLSNGGQGYPQEDIQIYNKSSAKEDKYLFPRAEEESNHSTEPKPQNRLLGFDF